MGTTFTLNLGKTFDVKTLAAQASALSTKIKDNEKPTEEDRSILIVLNAGLENFLTGDYAVTEPDKDGWVEFGNRISEQFKCIGEQYGSTFHHESITADILARTLTPEFIFEPLPDYIIAAINWVEVDKHLKTVNSYYDMFIDGEVYYTGVHVSLNDSDIPHYE